MAIWFSDLLKKRYGWRPSENCFKSCHIAELVEFSFLKRACWTQDNKCVLDLFRTARKCSPFIRGLKGVTAHLALCTTEWARFHVKSYKPWNCTFSRSLLIKMFPDFAGSFMVFRQKQNTCISDLAVTHSSKE